MLIVVVSIYVNKSNEIRTTIEKTSKIQEEYSANNIDKIYENNIAVSGETVVDGVTIPDGFYYVGGSKEEGIVISDQEGDDLNNSKQGNQFVWVPVENYEDFKRQEGYYDKSPESYLSSRGEADSTGVNENENGDKVEETETTKKEAKSMYESVKRYGGFYIGRFETGKEENGNMVIRKGVAPYTDIQWSANGSMQETTGTTGGAIELSRAFDSIYGYTNLTSTLCYGVQWDAALNFIDPNYITNASIGSPNCTEDSYVRNSDSKGWYNQEKPTNTGCYQMKNIYDLAGNTWEWTMESFDSRYRVLRGGSCKYSGDIYPSSYHNNWNGSGYSDSSIGFRICLFINVPEEPLEVVDGVTVPKDFTHVTGDIKEEGIVVADNQGNEYVWIPVTKNEDGTPTDPYQSTNGKLRAGSDIEIQLGRYIFDTTTGKPSTTFTGTYTEDTIASHKEEFKNMTAKDIETFKTSIKENGGYYIARYEAGIEGGTLTSTSNSASNPDWTGYTGENMKLVLKSGATVWNYITQNRAANLCRDLADTKEYEGVTSDLTNSYAWDTAIVYIQSCGTNSNYANQIGLSTTSNTPSKAGQAILAQGNGAGKNDMQCNIYDMAGNCREWTTETSSDQNTPCVNRGGYYGHTTHYVSFRYGFSSDSNNINFSFRPILYL